MLIPTDKCSSHPSSKKLLFAENITEILNWSKCKKNWLWGTQLQFLHLQHNPKANSQETLPEQRQKNY